MIAWFDVLQENYKSDQLDAVQTAENMRTDVSLFLLKQMLLPTYQKSLIVKGRRISSVQTSKQYF